MDGDGNQRRGVHRSPRRASRVRPADTGRRRVRRNHPAQTKAPQESASDILSPEDFAKAHGIKSFHRGVCCVQRLIKSHPRLYEKIAASWRDSGFRMAELRPYLEHYVPDIAQTMTDQTLGRHLRGQCGCARNNRG